MMRLRRILHVHRTLIISIGFLTAFSFAVTYATPPAQPFNPGETLDPSCAPGEANCTVQVTPWTTLNNDIYYSAGNVGIGLTPGQLPLFTLSVNGTVGASGDTTLSGNSVILGNNTGSPHINVVARGDTDGLRLYSLQNPNGGDVNPPAIGFYRSTSTVSTLPRFRIVGSQPDGGDGDGFALSSPNSSITWITGGTDGVVFPDTSNVLDFQRQAYFSQGTIVVGNDTNGLAVPTNGLIRSGQKSLSTISDVDGSNLTIAAGGGTGAALGGGNIYFQTPDTNITTGAIQSSTTKAVLLRSGFFGIGTTTPDAYLTVLGNEANLEQLRLSFDTNNYTMFRTAADGSFTVTPSGGAYTVNMNVPFASARNLYKNSSNTSGAGVALEVQTGGINAGNPEVWFGISGELNHGWSMGLDHTDGDKFKISGPHGDIGNIGDPLKDKFTLDENGNVGIGTTSPSFKLQVGNTTVSGIVARFENSTGTCDINPTNASLSCSSDMNLKTAITNLGDTTAWSFNNNITIANQTVLDRLLALNPVDYNWKTEAPGAPQHAGFIAQEVREVFPDLVSQDPTSGLLSLSYTGLIPYTVEAIKEMNVTINNIDDLTKSNTWRDALMHWFADTKNGIQDFFSHTITTNQLCVKDDTGETCLTRQQINQLLQTNNTAPAPIVPEEQSQTPEVSSETPEVTAPVLVEPDTTQTTETQSPDSSDPAIDVTQ